MNTAPDDVIEATVDAPSAEAAAAFLAGAVRLASHALAHQPREHRRQVQRAVDENRATIHVQCDLPTGTATIMVNMQGGMANVLLRLEPREADKPLPFTSAARALVDRGLATIAPDARRQLLAALDDGSATIAVIADLPACDVRVLVHADGWAGVEEVLRIVPPATRTDFDA